jgi:hypothetical protein
VKALAHGDADVAVTSLETLAASGSMNANVALVRVQHWCGQASSARPADLQAQIAKLGNELPQEKAAKAAGVFVAAAKFVDRARVSCSKAPFNYQTIEARLRQSADSGHPASATELAKFVRDPAKRQALLQAAVDKNYAPAQYAVATGRLMAVQRGETTENVASIRLLLKQAGRTITKAKLDFANCTALGCDGHPADALTANAFGLDAARDGEAGAFLSMARMPWGARLSRVQHLAWQYFGDRLNEAGCMGDAYVPSAIAFTQTIKMMEKGQDAKMLEQAKAQADELWRDNGARATKEQGCS